MLHHYREETQLHNNSMNRVSHTVFILPSMDNHGMKGTERQSPSKAEDLPDSGHYPRIMDSRKYMTRPNQLNTDKLLMNLI